MWEENKNIFGSAVIYLFRMLQIFFEKIIYENTPDPKKAGVGMKEGKGVSWRHSIEVKKQ